MSGLSPAVMEALQQLAGVNTSTGYQAISQIQAIASSTSAAATGPNAVLYSGGVGSVSSSVVGPAVASQTGFSVINSTDRASFLNQPQVRAALTQCYEAVGVRPLPQAGRQAGHDGPVQLPS